MGMRTIPFEGRNVTGADVPFKIVEDGAVVIEAEDGARIRVRPIVFNVVKTGEKTANGERLYIVQQTIQVALDRAPSEDTQ